MNSPITYRQVLDYIKKTPSQEEALRFLTELRDARMARLEQTTEQICRAVDFALFQTYAGLYQEPWYEQEVDAWLVRLGQSYDSLGDEHTALQAGIDRLLSS